MVAAAALESAAKLVWSNKGKTPRSTNLRPPIELLRSRLVKQMHAGLLAPSRNDLVYLARSEHAEYLRDVVVAATKMSPSDAENLLKAQYNVPPVNKTDSPTPSHLRQWLGKTMSNVHCSLRKCIFPAWAKATEYDGS
ncbi:hypothetical protein I4F81_010106 [Pyropia yezoensis]|uniref:Uncharacterized protein n=1 Tax=Pyropia yezoensis TaxID=2788 RepID=A0ACC3CBI5_PYRYE|nr:hypothetical protein I4F81_010106 [Neopyropia yezoensis]